MDTPVFKADRVCPASSELLQTNQRVFETQRAKIHRGGGRAQLVEHTILDLKVVGLGPILAVKITQK